MESLFDFVFLKDPSVRYVVLGIILIALSGSIVGCFAFLRKRSLIGDAVAHAVLPGICLAFLIFHSKNILVLMTGAVITGWLAIAAIDVITRYSRIKADAALGIALSVFFAAGIVLMTMIQKMGIASQSGLDHFLFGNAATISKEDAIYFSIIGLLILATVILFFKPFKLISFDHDYAVSLGLPVKTYELILSIITVMAIAAGIQAVGVVLIAAVLITPAAAARYWTNNLVVMLLLAVLIASAAGIGGAYISYVSLNMPTGPWIIVLLTAIAVISFAISPKRGFITRAYIVFKNRRKILDENVLKAFYHLGESNENFNAVRSEDEIRERREFDKSNLTGSLKRLKVKGKLNKKADGWQLTEKGLNGAKRIIKLHRLWELYLTEYLKIAEDHVHEDAEAIEHVITPEVEKQLEKLLGYPSTDPHGKKIDY